MLVRPRLNPRLRWARLQYSPRPPSWLVEGEGQKRKGREIEGERRGGKWKVKEKEGGGKGIGPYQYFLFDTSSPYTGLHCKTTATEKLINKSELNKRGTFMGATSKPPPLA